MATMHFHPIHAATDDFGVTLTDRRGSVFHLHVDAGMAATIAGLINGPDKIATRGEPPAALLDAMREREARHNADQYDLEDYASGRRTMLIFDEAQNLSVETHPEPARREAARLFGEVARYADGGREDAS